MKRFGGEDTIQGKAGPCYVASGLAIVAAIIALVCLPRLDQDCLEVEDRKFRTILEMNGYQTDKMGTNKLHSFDNNHTFENKGSGVSMVVMERTDDRADWDTIISKEFTPNTRVS